MTNSLSSMPMPGAFTIRDNGAPPRLSGAKSHIFQPPRTPNASASSSLILTRSVGSVMSLDSTSTYRGRSGASMGGVRKRGREEYDGGAERARNGEYGIGSTGMAGESWLPESPKPFVNTRYQLAGGMDTPGLLAEQRAEESGYEDMNDFRKSLGERPNGCFGEMEEGDSYFPGEARRGFKQSPGGGWSKAAIQVAGVVVGKAWEFCKSSAAVFRGFQAGGGTGYKVNNGSHFEQVSAEEQSFWEEKNAHSFGEREGTLLPGQYPDDLDFIPDYMDNPIPEPNGTPERPSKRRQVSSNSTNDGLEKNWVVVPPAALTPSRPPLNSSKPVPRYSMHTASSGGRRGPTATSSHRPASSAGFRAGLGGTPRRGPPPSSRVSHAGSPSLNPTSRASFASPRSPASSASSRIPRATTTGSPLRKQNSDLIDKGVESPAAQEARRDAQKWATKRQREEREQDESLRRLDEQLKAMIREGKEALGTKVSVEFEGDEDPGFATPKSPSKFSHSRSGSSLGGHSRQGSSLGGVKKWNF